METLPEDSVEHQVNFMIEKISKLIPECKVDLNSSLIERVSGLRKSVQKLCDRFQEKYSFLETKDFSDCTKSTFSSQTSSYLTWALDNWLEASQKAFGLGYFYRWSIRSKTQEKPYECLLDILWLKRRKLLKAQGMLGATKSSRLKLFEKETLAKKQEALHKKHALRVLKACTRHWNYRVLVHIKKYLYSWFLNSVKMSGALRTKSSELTTSLKVTKTLLNPSKKLASAFNRWKLFNLTSEINYYKEVLKTVESNVRNLKLKDQAFRVKLALQESKVKSLVLEIHTILQRI